MPISSSLRRSLSVRAEPEAAPAGKTPAFAPAMNTALGEATLILSAEPMVTSSSPCGRLPTVRIFSISLSRSKNFFGESTRSRETVSRLSSISMSSSQMRSSSSAMPSSPCSASLRASRRIFSGAFMPSNKSSSACAASPPVRPSASLSRSLQRGEIILKRNSLRRCNSSASESVNSPKPEGFLSHSCSQSP